MNLFKFSLKFITPILFVIISFSAIKAKNLDRFNEGNHISDYFSGILLLNDNQYNESYKYLKKLNGLEESHLNYSRKYLHSLVNLNKFKEAFNYAINLEKRKLDTYDSNLIIGIYYLKNNQFDIAQKYFFKIKNRNSRFILNKFISNSLLNWSSLDKLDLKKAQNKMDTTDEAFENLKVIQNVFLHCFYDSQKTEFFFQKSYF